MDLLFSRDLLSELEDAAGAHNIVGQPKFFTFEARSATAGEPTVPISAVVPWAQHSEVLSILRPCAHLNGAVGPLVSLQSLPLDVVTRSRSCHIMNVSFLGTATRSLVDHATSFTDTCSRFKQVDLCLLLVLRQFFLGQLLALCFGVEGDIVFKVLINRTILLFKFLLFKLLLGVLNHLVIVVVTVLVLVLLLFGVFTNLSLFRSSCVDGDALIESFCDLNVFLTPFGFDIDDLVVSRSKVFVSDVHGTGGLRRGRIFLLSRDHCLLVTHFSDLFLASIVRGNVLKLTMSIHVPSRG